MTNVIFQASKPRYNSLAFREKLKAHHKTLLSWRYYTMDAIQKVWNELKNDYQEYVEIAFAMAYGWQVR